MYVDACAEYFRTRVRLPPPPPFKINYINKLTISKAVGKWSVNLNMGFADFFLGKGRGFWEKNWLYGMNFCWIFELLQNSGVEPADLPIFFNDIR